MEVRERIASVQSTIQKLNSFEIEQPEDIHKQVEQVGLCLKFLSANTVNLVIDNIINLVDHSKITVWIPTICKEEVSIRATPYMHLLIFKLLQKVNYNNVHDHDIIKLHDAMLKWAFAEKHVLELLRSFKILYSCKHLLLAKDDELNAFRKLSYQRDKCINKQLYLTLECFIHFHFTREEQEILLNQCLSLLNFGNVEYYISCGVLKKLIFYGHLKYVESLMKFVMQGFLDNNLASASLQLFKVILSSIDYEDFLIYVHPHLQATFSKPSSESSRSLTAHFIKYIIPEIVRTFNPPVVYNYVEEVDLYFKLTTYIQIFIINTRIRNRNLYLGTVEEVSRGTDVVLKNLALHLLCYYPCSKHKVTNNDIKLFKELILCLNDFTSETRHDIRYFISQMSLSRYHYSDEQTLKEYVDFYKWIYQLVYSHAASKDIPLTQIVSELFVYSMMVLKEGSSYLVVPYKLNPTYTINPLNEIVYKELNVIIGDNLKFIYNVFMTTPANTLIAECALSKLLFNTLTKDMIKKIHAKTIDMFKNSNPCIKKKALVSSEILLKYYRDKSPRNIAILKSEMENKIVSALEEFDNNRSIEQAGTFDISTPVEVISKIVNIIPNTFVIKDYEDECLTCEKRIFTVVTAYARLYRFIEFFASKRLRRNMEASLIALFAYHHELLKKLHYAETAIDRYLDTVDTLMSLVDEKKVVTTVVDHFRDIIKATPQYQVTYNDFYSKIKNKYAYNSKLDTLRMPRGVRSAMHIIFRMASSSFMQNEIEVLIPDDPENHYHHNFRLNLLELLISDASLKSVTQIYIPAIFEKALRSVDHEVYLIRNSSIRLIGVIANRLLGPMSGNKRRELSIHDVFAVYPEVKEVVSRYIFSDSMGINSRIAALRFLCESNNRSYLYLPAAFDIQLLTALFSHKILGFYAAKAFLAGIPDNLIYKTLLIEFKSVVPLSDNDLLRINYQIRNIKRLIERFMEFDDEDNASLKEQKNDLQFLLNRLELQWNQPMNISKHISLPVRPLRCITNDPYEDD